MNSRAENASDFVKLLKRINKREYQSNDVACEAIKDEIEIQGEKFRKWLEYHRRDSRLQGEYKKTEKERQRYCDDLDKLIGEINSILESPDTNNKKILASKLDSLQRTLERCIGIAEDELRNLGVRPEG